MLDAAQKTDAALRQAVQDALTFDPRIAAAHIGLTANAGIITMTGKVPSFIERYHAGQVVLGLQDVRGLADELEVDVLGQHRRDDEDIVQALKAAIDANSLIPPGQIRSAVHAGLVTLSGECDWHDQKDAAEQSTRCVPGVTGVINTGTVRPQERSDWQEVRQRIIGAFQRHASLDAKQIAVALRAGAVTFTGAVRSWDERRDAENAAWLGPGVRHVDNHIAVQHPGSLDTAESTSWPVRDPASGGNHMSTARWTDITLGALLVMLGIWGLMLAGPPSFGVFPFNTLSGAVILIAGTVLLGGAVDTETAKSAAGLIGVVLALTGVTGLFSQLLFGLVPPSAWTTWLLILSGALLLYDWLDAPDPHRPERGRRS